MAASETTPKGDVPALIAKVAALQNLKEYAELNWTGRSRITSPSSARIPPSCAAPSSASTT